jgi:hypothetical protein
MTGFLDLMFAHMRFFSYEAHQDKGEPGFAKLRDARPDVELPGFLLGTARSKFTKPSKIFSHFLF